MKGTPTINQSENKKKIYLLVSVGICFILIYIFNKLYPLSGEDFDYAYFWVPDIDHPDRVQSIWDIIQSQYNHYMHWGGRNIAHGIDQFLLMIGERWHDMLNTLAFIFLCYIIYRISNTNNKTKVSVFCFGFFALWFLQPTFIIDVFWLTYSANYLWTSMLIVAFVYFYYSHYRGSRVCDGVLRSALLFFFGIVAGWTNENMGPALIFLIVAFILLTKFEDKNTIPKWAICGLIGVIIGYTILFLAPGNYVRIGDSDSSVWNIFSPDMLAERLESIGKGFFYALLTPTIIHCVLYFFFIKTSKSSEKRKIQRASLLFLASAFVALGVLFLTPGFGRHILFGITTLAIIAIAILYANLELKTKVVRVANISLLTLLLIGFAFDYYKKYIYLDYMYNFWKNREVFVEQEKAKGIKDIIFTDYLEPNYEYGTADMYDCPECWINRMYARYYGLNSVRVKPIHENKD